MCRRAWDIPFLTGITYVGGHLIESVVVTVYDAVTVFTVCHFRVKKG